jgi:hypothetical protein
MVDRDARRALMFPNEEDRLRDLNAEMLVALQAAEKYMTRQRSKSRAPFDPEALKQVRAAIAKAGGGRNSLEWCVLCQVAHPYPAQDYCPSRGR